MRPRFATRTLALAGALALLAGACGGGSKEKVAIRIISPVSGATVKGNVLDLRVRATGIQVRPPGKSGSNKVGRYHLFADRDPVAPGQLIPTPDTGVAQFTRNRIRVSGLTVGPHRFTIILGNGKRRRIGTAQAATAITVAGPSIRARVPGAVAAGQSVNVKLEVQNVTLVPADGDTSGKTGHVVLFIDRNPTPAGQPIPEGKNIVNTSSGSAATPPLGPGRHSIWAVLADGKNVAFDPPVEDRAEVLVT